VHVALVAGAINAQAIMKRTTAKQSKILEICFFIFVPPNSTNFDKIHNSISGINLQVFYLVVKQNSH
jgi:hypothetical protein